MSGNVRALVTASSELGVAEASVAAAVAVAAAEWLEPVPVSAAVAGIELVCSVRFVVYCTAAAV